MWSQQYSLNRLQSQKNCTTTYEKKSIEPIFKKEKSIEPIWSVGPRGCPSKETWTTYETDDDRCLLPNFQVQWCVWLFCYFYILLFFFCFKKKLIIIGSTKRIPTYFVTSTCQTNNSLHSHQNAKAQFHLLFVKS